VNQQFDWVRPPDDGTLAHSVAPPAPGQSASNGQAGPSEPNQILFLIALKNHWIYTAIAFWLEGAMLHYITPQGVHNQVSLNLVDVSTSSKVNNGLPGGFVLPTR
jgi:hypothetical protein